MIEQYSQLKDHGASLFKERTSFHQGSWTDYLNILILILILHISDPRCSVKSRDRCVRSWPVYSSMPGVWPTSPPSPRPCLIGSPSTVPTTTTLYLWPSAREKVAYSPLESPLPTHTYWQIYAIFKTLKKSVKAAHADHHNLFVEVKSSAVFCIIDMITLVKVLHFDVSAIFSF